MDLTIIRIHVKKIFQQVIFVFHESSSNYFWYINLI